MLIGCVTNVATVKHFALMQVPLTKTNLPYLTVKLIFMTVLIQVSMFKILWIKFVYCVYGERCQRFN